MSDPVWRSSLPLPPPLTPRQTGPRPGHSPVAPAPPAAPEYVYTSAYKHALRVWVVCNQQIDSTGFFHQKITEAFRQWFSVLLH